MNYLAHAHLSFRNPGLLIGNLIADFVKGKQIYDFSEEIQAGIRLHRQIDEYTDHHPLTRQTKTLFSDTAGRYDSPFLDIAFDHFLALDTMQEPPEGWLVFSLWCYKQIDHRIDELPKDFKRLYSYMKEENWLYSYRYPWMIEKSFGRLTQRAAFLKNDINVYSDFENKYSLLQAGYDQFFPQLVKFAESNI